MPKPKGVSKAKFSSAHAICTSQLGKKTPANAEKFERCVMSVSRSKLKPRPNPKSRRAAVRRRQRSKR